jgi:hypothetical protein
MKTPAVQVGRQSVSSGIVFGGNSNASKRALKEETISSSGIEGSEL